MKDIYFRRHFILYFLLSLAATFFLPYAFPSNTVSHSYSYMVGFNNMVGILVLVILAFGSFIYSFKYSETIRIWKTENTLKTIEPQKTFVKCSILSTILLLIIGLFYSIVDFWGFFEGEYSYHFLYALQYGHRLYEDVQYIYGPLSIYPIHFLTVIGINIHLAYFVTLALYQLLGYYFIYDVLKRFDITENVFNAILIIVAIIGFPMATGFNYCLLRFAVLPWSICKLIFELPQKKLLSQVLWTFLFIVINLLYSPEIGLCYIVIATLWYAVDGIIKKNIKDVYMLLLTLLSVGILCFVYPEYFSSVVQAGSGGASFPFVPSLIISLVVAVFLSYGILVGFQIKDFKNNYNLIIAEASMIITSVGGLGRCDPTHVFNFCLFAIVVSYIVYSKLFPQKIISILFLLVVLSYFPFNILCIYKDVAEKMLKNTTEYVAQKNGKPKDDSLETFLSGLDGKVTSIQPHNSAYVFLNENYDYKETYFGYTPQWIGVKEGFDRELKELKRIDADYIIAPFEYEKKWLDPYYMGMSQLLFLSYYPVKPKRDYHPVLYGDLIKYLNTEYELLRSYDRYSILKKKNATIR